ncbi:helix-turn-helix domain-containing protein [Streptomyces sp. NBRC 110028]|uniref:helix-turn-helix domain-containing protein n=1 Tax=Streptomyces sp. NBRC 110028 TaxID=1621260 RepID=UPI000B11641B|nr:helix-turn-helix domain-containing protein [Streptomyces sp. NBRC 110028]
MATVTAATPAWAQRGTDLTGDRPRRRWSEPRMEPDPLVVNSTGAETDAWRGAFLLESAAPGNAPEKFDVLQRVWDTQLGAVFPMPALSPASVDGIRARGRLARIRDVAIVDVHGPTAIRSPDTFVGAEDLVGVSVVRRGAWTFGGPRDRFQHTISAGQFLLRHFGTFPCFKTAPNTTTQFLILPLATFKPLLGDRSIAGPLDSAEMRLLVTHANMVHATVADLGPAGLHAAHGALIELAKAVVKGRFDDVEPRLAPALAQAAKDLADSHLTDPELGTAMLARELNVSVSTLQRAFARVEDSVSAYIRRRRLEEARLALTAPHGGLKVSEIAAHWHFADSSHFIRAFKKRYGQTPTEYARSARGGR